MKTEGKFIEELEHKAREQRKLMETEIIPNWAKGIGDWLVIHPWRVLIPISCITYYVLRIMLGIQYREWILGLFGGFAK